jgi:hypothetical protein
MVRGAETEVSTSCFGGGSGGAAGRLGAPMVRIAVLALAVLAQSALASAAAAGANPPPPGEAPPSVGAAIDSQSEPAAGISGAKPPLPGQLSTRFAIDEANPEANIPSTKERNQSPLEFGYYLQDLLERAEGARKAKDFSAVIRYYRAVAKAVPESAKGWSKLCESYEIVNDRERAIIACRYAIDRLGVELQDYVRYVHLILKKSAQGKAVEFSVAERTELDRVLAHLEKQEGLELAVGHLRCEIGLKLKDVAMMETCTRALAKVAPDDPKTVVFQWSLAVMKGQTAEAQHLLERARATGVKHDGVELMESVTPSARGPSRTAKIAGATALLTIVFAAVLFAAIRRRRALTGRPAV